MHSWRTSSPPRTTPSTLLPGSPQTKYTWVAFHVPVFRSSVPRTSTATRASTVTTWTTATSPPSANNAPTAPSAESTASPFRVWPAVAAPSWTPSVYPPFPPLATGYGPTTPRPPSTKAPRKVRTPSSSRRSSPLTGSGRLGFPPWAQPRSPMSSTTDPSTTNPSTRLTFRPTGTGLQTPRLRRAL